MIDNVIMLGKILFVGEEVIRGIGSLAMCDIPKVKRVYRDALARLFPRSIDAEDAPPSVQELHKKYIQYYRIGCQTGRLDFYNSVEVISLESGHTLYSRKGKMSLHRPAGGWLDTLDVTLVCAVDSNGNIVAREMHGFCEIMDIEQL